MFKRFMLCLAACLLMLLAFSTGALALYSEENGISYYIDEQGGWAEVSAYTGSAEHVVIPSHTSGGYTVVGIGGASFSLRTFIKSISIPSTVTYIKSGAFSSCDALTTINIPDGITQIAADTFWGCDLLTSIDLPDSVTVIGEEAFYASGLITIDFPPNITSIGDYAFASCSNLTEIHFPDTLTSYGRYVLHNSKNLVHVTLPDCFDAPQDFTENFPSFSKLESCVLPAGFERIPGGFFAECPSLKSITLPDSVQSIGQRAFVGCTSLTEIEFPEALTEIGKDAFDSCTGLTQITVPDSVKIIGDGAFKQCAALESIVFEGSVDSFGSLVLWQDKALRTVILPEGVTQLEANMFKEYPALETIVIPSTASIQRMALYGCPELQNVTISEGVTYIGEYAFAYSPLPNGITLPQSLTTLDTGAFCGSGLTSIVVPGASGNTVVGDSAFFRCQGLTSITLEEGVVSIGENAFSASQLVDSLPESPRITSITLPSTLTSMGGRAFENCFTLETVDIRGRVAISDSAFENCTALRSISNPYITAIGSAAFKNCTSLTRFTVPDGVPAISDSAFHGCTQLSSIDLPDSITRFGSYSFYNCGELSSLRFPESLSSIGDYAFYACNKLDFILLPDGVTSIGERAFEATDGFIRHIWVPASVTSIGQQAFNCCNLFCYSGTAASSVWPYGGTRYIDYPKVFNYPQEDVYMEPEQTLQLDLWYFPPEPYYECTWDNSNPEVATIDENNLITAIEGYSTYLRYRCPSRYLGVNFSVIVQKPMEDFTLDPVPLFIDYAEVEEDPSVVRSIYLDTWTPEDAEDRDLTWANSNPAVAEIDGYARYCRVYPISRGQTVVTATSKKGVSHSCLVTVDYAYKISYSPRLTNLAPGQSTQLTITITDQEGNPVDVGYTLSSRTPETASVTQDGTVTAHENGEACLMITLATGQTRYIYFDVSNNVSDMEIDGLGGEGSTLGTAANPLCVPVGLLFTPAISVTPETADDPTYSMNIADTRVLAEESGMIAAQKAGTTRVTFIANSNDEITCRLYVKAIDMNTLQLPASLRAVSSEAFSGASAEYIILPETIESIAEDAFAGLDQLRVIRVDSASFTPDVFPANENLLIVCAPGSAAERYARQNNIPFIHFTQE
ncbi:MAG: leucine-rich repeat protein [Clostridia bacterium]|nr:leucine-rich repeat protein [Clostridia bacterium]